MIDQEQEDCSACCGAEIVMLDVCSECKEHCDIFVDDDDSNVYTVNSLEEMTSEEYRNYMLKWMDKYTND